MRVVTPERTRAFLFSLVIVLSGCGVASAPTPGQAQASQTADVTATSAFATTDRPLAPPVIPRPTPDLNRARFSTAGWKTDFTTATVPFDEISSGGPPRDGIPPLDKPIFTTVAQADGWLTSVEPVIELRVGADARAYPLQVMIGHEIANDEIGGVPVSVTFCPLCNTAIAFDRRLDGRVLDFGTTGNLRHSDLVMWDRQTESWWQQITGEAIVGQLTGKRLTVLPATIVSWAEFKARDPDGKVLARETGFNRSYGSNPYVGYDRIDQPPFLFQGKLDGRLPPMERVVVLEVGEEAVAYPFRVLRQRRIITDSVAGGPLVVLYQPGTASALDAPEIARSRDIGAAGVFRPEVDGRILSFEWRNDTFVDRETGSRWSVLGKAVEGPLSGKRLEAVVHLTPFWFAWAAFKPETRVAN
ncbi:MAG: DUF3179 domain-containing protein [Chloroflexota bacterium]|nr:MAG: DUF3179 domain-containing protein [Chloroflexota bacterium]